MSIESGVFADNKQAESKDVLEFEGRERGAAEKEEIMTVFCADRGNPISIIESGKMPVTFGLKQEFSSINDAALKRLLRNAVVALSQFLSSPTFTDSFHADHGARREWERLNKPDMEEDVSAYYESNRLGLNVLSQATNILYILNDPDYSHYFTPEVLDKLSFLSEKVQKVIPDNFRLYGEKSDEEKLKLIPAVEAINRDLLYILASQTAE